MTLRFNPECCCCTPKQIGSVTFHGTGTWDLTPYQGDGIGDGGFYWRLRNNYMGYIPMRYGCIDKNGRLVGLPDSISSDSYKYTWTFVLETGCPDENGKILWANGERSSVFQCP
jgi:hypothetical protein